MEEKTYLIVNPKGCMHIVSEAHARARLQIAGWRLATKEEQELYFEASEQRFDRPLAKPFQPDKDLALNALPESATLPTKKAARGKAKDAEVTE